MVIEFIYAFLSTFGFSVLFNIPRKVIVYTSTTGALGWCVYSLVEKQYDSKISSAFLGAFVVALIGEYLARRLKKPATVFVIPGIIPLVPGYGLYYAMLKIIENDFEKAIQVGFETGLVAIGIASAIIIATSLIRLIGDVKKGLKV